MPRGREGWMDGGREGGRRDGKGRKEGRIIYEIDWNLHI